MPIAAESDSCLGMSAEAGAVAGIRPGGGRGFSGLHVGRASRAPLPPSSAPQLARCDPLSGSASSKRVTVGWVIQRQQKVSAK